MLGAMHAPDLDALLDIARAAARAGTDEVQRHYGRTLDVQLKPDASPVTAADLAAERAIRAVLAARCPGHAVYGEELGRDAVPSPFLWLIDPIDGTKSFVRGYPMFSTQVALMHEGRLVLGVSAAPWAGETAWAARGRGAWLDGRPLRVAGCTDLAAAAVSFGNLKSLAAGPAWARLGQVVLGANRVRGYGDFYHYHRLAAGALDAVIESDVNILDIAALVVVVEEAGGVFTDLAGRPVGLGTTSVLAAATPGLHAALAATIGWTAAERV
jgi:histidinol-phosphatase